MDSAFGIIIWLILWPTVFGFSYYLIFKKRITYIEGFQWMFFYWLAACIIAFLIFKGILMPILKDFSITPFIILLFIYASILVLYSYAKKRLKRPVKLIEKYGKHEQIIMLEPRYLISKSPSILFQQILITAFLLILKNNSFSVFQSIMIFMVLFSLFHIHITKKTGLIVGLLYVSSSLLGAIIFPLLILSINYGFVYSYIAHLLFYGLGGIGIWIYQQKSIRSFQ